MDFLTKDSRGGASSTKPLVVVPWLLLCAKFAIAGMTLPYIGRCCLSGSGVKAWTRAS